MAESVHAFCRLAIEAQDQYIAEQVAKLRELRAFCAQHEQTVFEPVGAVRIAYALVGRKLDTILNNVTGVEREV